MASQMNGPDGPIEDRDAQSENRDSPTDDRNDAIDDHLRSALESSTDDVARYHLREALQLKLAEMHRP